MSNPFPGMNPYLEARSLWESVHHRLITYAADTLQESLGERYYVSIEERVYVEEPQREIKPDVALARRTAPPQASVAMPDTECDVPVVLEAAGRVYTEGAIHILDRANNLRLVTVIEVLSPTNKQAHKGRELYLRKQGEILKSDVHLVEIDLLRDGEYTLAPPLTHLREQVRQPWHYMVSISRADDPNHYLLYPRTVRERLPVVPVPLAIGEGNVPLDVQLMLNQCYERGRYAGVVDYTQPPPPPPFSPEDEVWIDTLLKSKGLR